MELYELGAAAAEGVRTGLGEQPAAVDSPALVGELAADILLGHAQALHKATRYALGARFPPATGAEAAQDEAVTAAGEGRVLTRGVFASRSWFA